MSALMAGLYYDPDALRAAEALTQGWSAEERQKLRDDAPLLGLAAEIRGRDLRSIAIGHAGDRPWRPQAARAAEREGRGRDHLPSSPRGDCRERARAGAALDRALRGAMGSLGRAGV